MATSNKLKINSQFLLYTTYSTINNQKVKVVGVLNYDEAQAIPYSIKSLAINEKVIDLENGDTEGYLKDQLYFHCIVTDSNGDTSPILVWDDIIDVNKTTMLSVTYTYSLALEVNSDVISNLPTIENSITTFINNTYNSTVKPTLISYGMESNTTDNTSRELAMYKELFESAKALADKMSTLKQIETLINYFAKDDMYAKVTGISESLSYIQDTVSSISEMIS
ncbi:MAG: hypothetical protein ACRC5M_06650 [Anaeroplasmataceae bacterium]